MGRKAAIGELLANQFKMKRTKTNNPGRRYFYPLISQFPSYRGLVSAKPENLPVAEKVARQVLCLPIFPDLELCTVDKIASLILTQ